MRCIKCGDDTESGYVECMDCMYIEEINNLNNNMKHKQEVIEWAASKGILEKATPLTQALKTLEEVTELLQAINKGDIDETLDAYGDILVTIIIGAHMFGLDIEDCLESAYNVIKYRTGSIKNGTFVKDK